MKTIHKAALMLLVTSLLAAAQETGGSKAADEQNVRDAVEKMATAWGHNDGDALEKLWSADYTFTNPSGIFLTKAQRLSMLRSGRVKVEDYSIDTEEVRVYGDTAVVTYRSTVKRRSEGHEIDTEQHMVLTVLVKQDGTWRAVAQQSTPVLMTPKRDPNPATNK